MASLIADVVSVVAHNFGLQCKDEFKAACLDALNDAGVNVDEWRDSYYSHRFPPRMTASTMAFQLRNMEVEIKQLRLKAYEEGYNRGKRTLSAFDVTQEEGHTVLKPKTRLAEIILQNSRGELKLSGIPNGELERTLIELEEMRSENNDLQVAMGAIRAAFKDAEKERKRLEIENTTLTHDLEQTVIHMQEEIDYWRRKAEDAKTDEQLVEKIQILEQRLSDVDGVLADAVDKAEKRVWSIANARLSEMRHRRDEALLAMRSAQEDHEYMQDRLDELEADNARLDRMEMARDALAELQISDNESDDDEDYNFLYFGEREHR
uniref:Non-structural protein 2 n=1 Tax=Rotavirus G TaxID=183407 RepID=A0A3G1RPF2_9REOV|nr:MAG: non-structural protein 2 [Rotavirus G]